MHLETVGAEDVRSKPALTDEIDSVLMAAYRTGSRRDRFLRWLDVQPDGWVVARSGAGEPIIGCGGFIAYPDGGFGWVGLIAVTPNCGRRGVGREITQWCVDRLSERGCAAALDGSAQGAPLYAAMGFVDHGYSAVYEFTGSLPPVPRSASVAIELVRNERERGELITFDATRFGADRGRLLRLLDDRYGPGRTAIARVGAQVVGYVVAQDDSIGPLVADDDVTASALLRYALTLGWSTRPTLRPGPELQRDATTPVGFLELHGFVLTRTLRRQHLHVDSLPGRRSSLWAMASFGEG